MFTVSTWEGTGVAFYQHSFNSGNTKVLNATSYFPASGRDKDALNLQRPHEFNCNLLAALLGAVWDEWRWAVGLLHSSADLDLGVFCIVSFFEVYQHFQN